MKTTEYMTVEEAAELWKVRPERIEYTCEQGGISGAAKLSGQWIIPAGTVRPVIRQIPQPPKEQSNVQSGRTRLQQALVDGFKDGNVPLGVFERKIGNATYIVTTYSSKDAKQTISEKILSMMLRDLDVNMSASDYSKTMKEFRQKEIEQQPSYSEYMENAKEYLTKMGFGEEDIAMLLDKYAEAYKPLEEL